MKITIKFFILLTLLLSTLITYSQEITTQKDTTYWKKKNMVGFDLNQISFVNWNAGGNTSISGLAKGNFIRKYERGHTKWLNELIVKYGVNKQDGVELRKTDDEFQFNSTMGHRTDSTSNWFYSAKFNFKTQFSNGYSYPNTDLAISKPFAPAYTFLGAGAEYANKEDHYIVYLSPITLKNTMVLDSRLANQGAFGVRKAKYDEEGNMISKGEQFRIEAGILVTAQHKEEVWKNISIENRLSLYSDYINNFGNIDVEWQMSMNLIVNEYVRANIGIHLIYDDDIQAKKDIAGVQQEIGPRIQLKQMIGVGLVYNF
jgi:hypothetical protein